jgi:hypothetical protein
MKVFDPIKVKANQSAEVIRENMQKSLKRGLPELQTDSQHRERLVICGGGPSIEDNLRKLRKESKHTVFCVNGALGYLLKKGITPDACVLADPSPIL